MTVFVLWEDEATGSIESFGPHAFLIACVASRLVVPARYKLMRSKVLGGKSCRGNSNVLRELGNGPLWDRNLETLLSLVGRGMPELPRALSKDLLARDKILHRAAADEDLMRKACAEMPSWELLVTTVTELIQGDMSLIASGCFRD